jgi:F0F1-type ATP synthase assembly protein I
MVSLVRAERKAARFVKDNFDIDDLYDQLDTLRNYVQELSASVGKGASRQFGRARDFASETAHDAEEAMKDNLAASLILAVGLGVVVGYFLRRSTE